MKDIKNKTCRYENCCKILSSGIARTKTSEYCAPHSPDEMVDMKGRKCVANDCGMLQSLGVTDTKTVDYCAPHSLDVKSKTQCMTKGRGKTPSDGVAGSKTAEYCAQNALEGMAHVKKKKRRIEGCGTQPLFGAAGGKVRKLRSIVLGTPWMEWST